MEVTLKVEAGEKGNISAREKEEGSGEGSQRHNAAKIKQESRRVFQGC